MTQNVKHFIGDIFNTTQPAIGHGVNCQANMNSGIANIISKKFPEIFPTYVKACENGDLTPGGLLVTPTNTGLLIFNLASQNLSGANAHYGMLADALVHAYMYAKENNISGFALPRIGAGVGGLDWESVLQIIELTAKQFPTIETEIWTLPE